MMALTLSACEEAGSGAARLNRLLPRPAIETAPLLAPVSGAAPAPGVPCTCAWSHLCRLQSPPHRACTYARTTPAPTPAPRRTYARTLRLHLRLHLRLFGTAIQNPIMFVTQVPCPKKTSLRVPPRSATTRQRAEFPRGGDLRFAPDGPAHLTKEAASARKVSSRTPTPYAVRDPAPLERHQGPCSAWWWPVTSFTVPTSSGSYEVSNFGAGQTVTITKVPNQPTNYNNVSPLYAAMTACIHQRSAAQRSGFASFHRSVTLYPNLDEYESNTQSVASGASIPTGYLHILQPHTPVARSRPPR